MATSSIADLKAGCARNVSTDDVVGAPSARNFVWRKLHAVTSFINTLEAGCARDESTDDVVGAPFLQARLLEA